MADNMVNRNLVLLIVSFAFFVDVFASSNVANVGAYQKDRKIIIEYDLLKQNEVTPYVSINGAPYVRLINVTGDVGSNITSGHKKIVWNVLSQFEDFVYSDVRFLIVTGSDEIITDICGNRYPVVSIGEQVWMAENLRCSKYDTKSEAYKNRIYSIPTNEEYDSKSYYIDVANKNNWIGSSWSEELTPVQISKLGYLYNWAAAVGLEDGMRQTIEFPDKRQGICPNGWHIPTKAEWQMLSAFLGGKKSDDAKQLKTSSGWCNNGDGTNIHNFSALPAGFAEGGSIEFVGKYSLFWTASLDENYGKYAYSCDISSGDNYIRYGIGEKHYGRSVRCIKD